MTPMRLLALVGRAVGRVPTRQELEDWGDALACPPHLACPAADCVHDVEADEALRQHRRASTFPPTPADVRRLAVPMANARVEAQLRAERERAVPGARGPTAEFLEARRRLALKQAARQREMDRALESTSEQPTEETA